MNIKEKFLWYTDTHLDKVLPWTKVRFIKHIIEQSPKGIFITGDISNGITTCLNLKLLSTFVNCPIYFILGNHDYHFSSIEKTHDKIRQLCLEHPNLIWVTDQDVIKLNDEVALIGTEGWYDVSLGDPKYLKFTFDWFLTKDFRKLSNMSERIKAFQALADESCEILSKKLNSALDQNYKTVYIMTHFPPWKEATRDETSFMGEFWLPYNVNLRLGKTIEGIMKDRHKRNVTVLAGHTHTDCWIHVSRNIECKVNEAKYYGGRRNEEHIFI